MAAAAQRIGYVQTTSFLVALCLSTVATKESCTLENFKDDDFSCNKLLHCRQPSDWTSLSAEIKTKSDDDRLCAIVVDCADTVTISNVNFQTIGGRFDQVLSVIISRCNTTQVHLAEDMYFVFKVDLNGNAFDSLDFMKDWQDSEIKALHFYNNRIRNVRQKDFSKFNHLSSLRLDSNLITDVEARSFINNHKLVSVSLANNRLQTVGENMFGGMDGLKVVHLAGNRINSMDVRAFVKVHLDSLDLSYNDLTAVPNSAFVDSSVVSLNISNCQLSNIPSRFLSSLERNLTTLDISYNNIEHVATDAFAQLSQLRVVYHAGVNIDPSLLPAATGITTTTSPATTTTTTTSATTTTKITRLTTTTSTTTSAATTKPTTTSQSPAKTSSKFTTTKSSTTSQAPSPPTPSTGSKTPSTGSNTLIWVIVAFAVLTVVTVVIMVILRTQPWRKTDVQQTPPSHGNQNIADGTESMYDTIPADHRPDYVALDVDRARRDRHVYDSVTATSTSPSQYATLNPGHEPEQTYTRLESSPAGYAATDLTARQPTTTASDTNTTAGLYMSLNKSKDGPYEVPYEAPMAAGALDQQTVLRTDRERPASEYHV